MFTLSQNIIRNHSPLYSLISISLLLSLVALLLSDIVPTKAATLTADSPYPRDHGLAALIIPESAQLVADAYIVVFKTDAIGLAGLAKEQLRIEKLGGEINFLYTHALQGYAATLTPKALKAARSHPLVDFVIADMIMTLDDPVPTEESEIEGEASANGLQSSPVWGLDRIDQRNLPLNSKYTFKSIANNVHVYVLDTGIYTQHNEFQGRANKVFDAIKDGQKGNDCNGHGTHVAATIGGKIYGVAKRVKLHAVRVLNCYGQGTYAGVIAGVDWVTKNHRKPAVVNMSLGGSPNAALDKAINQSIQQGVVYVVAAGNSAANACNFSPARVPKAITVGATRIADARASFSNFGSCLDLFAPGQGIRSAYIGNKNRTAILSGTSMASPHVAGVAALYLSKKPSATPNQVAFALLNGATANIISARGSGSPNLLLFSRFSLLANALPDQLAVWSASWREQTESSN